MKSPFHYKEFEDYNKYTECQRSKYDGKLPWLQNYEKFYDGLLRLLLGRSCVKPVGKSCLCIGARQGTEVKIFTEMGSFAIGIDLNPGKDNRFVVTGDGSDIQYPDNSADIVYTNSFDHFLKMDETLDEIKRVLKPDGQFVFLLTTNPKDDKYGSTYWESAKEVVDYLVAGYGYRLVNMLDVHATKWFSYYVVLNANSDCV